MKVVGSSNRVHTYTLYLTRVGMYVDICPVYVKQKYVLVLFIQKEKIIIEQEDDLGKQ